MLNYALAFLKAMSALTVLSSVACGQTYTFSVLYSVEWLVDESNVILIAEYADEVTDVKPKILRTLKGQQEVVQWPLTKAILRAGALQPDSAGRIRLLFIRGTAELLQSVKLNRDYTREPSIREAFLGYPNLKVCTYPKRISCVLLSRESELLELQPLLDIRIFIKSSLRRDGPQAQMNSRFKLVKTTSRLWFPAMRLDKTISSNSLKKGTYRKKQLPFMSWPRSKANELQKRSSKR